MALPRIHYIAFGGTISSTAAVPGGPKPPKGGRPSGGLKGVRKGKRR